MKWPKAQKRESMKQSEGLNLNPLACLNPTPHLVHFSPPQKEPERSRRTFSWWMLPSLESGMGSQVWITSTALFKRDEPVWQKQSQPQLFPGHILRANPRSTQGLVGWHLLPVPRYNTLLPNLLCLLTSTIFPPPRAIFEQLLSKPAHPILVMK